MGGSRCRRTQDEHVVDMEAQVAERRRRAAELHAQLQTRAETMAVRARARSSPRLLLRAAVLRALEQLRGSRLHLSGVPASLLRVAVLSRFGAAMWVPLACQQGAGMTRGGSLEWASVQMLERAAAEAHMRATAARAEVNPLNHPLVQSYFGRK